MCLTATETSCRDTSESQDFVTQETVTLAYDYCGSQTEETTTPYVDGVAGTAYVSGEYAYDMWNQMTEATVTDASQTSTTVESAYNGEGLRTVKTVGTDTTYYLLENQNVILELDGNGDQTGRNVYGLNAISRTADSSTLYYLYNGHGDVTAMADDSGTVQATYYYDAFGVITARTGNFDNSISFSGYLYDAETGLYYLNARMYDPYTARFMQEDTYNGDAASILSLNIYVYCANNPMKYVDPSGHTPEYQSYDEYFSTRDFSLGGVFDWMLQNMMAMMLDVMAEIGKVAGLVGKYFGDKIDAFKEWYKDNKFYLAVGALAVLAIGVGIGLCVVAALPAVGAGLLAATVLGVLGGGLVGAGLAVGAQAIHALRDPSYNPTGKEMLKNGLAGFVSGALFGLIAMGVVTGGYTGLAAMTLMGLGGMESNAIYQLIMTKEIDPSECIQAGIIAFLLEGIFQCAARYAETRSTANSKAYETSNKGGKTSQGDAEAGAGAEGENAGNSAGSGSSSGNSTGSGAGNDVAASGAGSKLFKSQNLLESHYAKHGTEIQKTLGKKSYSITNYLDDANYIIQNGTYVPELNGYVRFIEGQKYGFVGLDRATGNITTFHIKTVSELIKSAPSLGLGK